MISGYLYKILDPGLRTLVIDKIIEDLYPLRNKFDAFVCRGFSSTIPSAIVAEHFNKELILSRKTAFSHGNEHEGHTNLKCVFIDDFICSGSTLKEVYKTVQQLECTLYAIYMYNQSQNATEKEVENIIKSTNIKVIGTTIESHLNPHNYLFEVIDRRGETDPLTKVKLHAYFDQKVCVCGKKKNRMNWGCEQCKESRPNSDVQEACDAHIGKVIELLRAYRNNE